MDQIITGKKSSKIKYITVILMIILHLFLNPVRDYISIFTINDTTIEYLFTMFCEQCVGIFVFLSGYGLVKKYGENINYKIIGRKILKFYINYWYIFLIFIPIGLYIGVIHFDFKTMILNLFALISNYNYEWWFVILYVQLLLVFPILNKIVRKEKKKKKIKKVYIISLIISIIAKMIYKLLMGNVIINIFMPLFMYQFEFLTGMMIAENGFFNKIKEKDRIKDKKIKVLILIFTIIIMNAIGTIPVISRILNPMLIPLFIYLLQNCIKEPKSVTIYKTSTNIWLTHTFFTTYYFPNIIWWPKYSILIVIWTIILTTIISLLLDKGLQKIYKLFRM